MSTILWRSRFVLLLLSCILGLFIFLSARTHASAAGVALDLAQPSVIAQSDGNPPPRILLVTAFFPLSKSKHTISEYEWWLSQFLRPITTDIYFYAPVEMESLIRKCRGDLPIIIDTTYPSPFHIPPLNASRDHYYKMHRQDRERTRHSPELYAVWNAKPYFLDEAIQKLSRAGKEYDYVFWNDAGSFRSNHKYVGWPDPIRVQEIWNAGSELSGEKAQDLIFFAVAGVPHPSLQHWVQDHGPVDTEFVEGSFFGGSPRTMAWWRRTFYAYHDHYLKMNIFVGKDQTLINAIFLLFPSRFITVWLDDPEAPAHIPTIGTGGALGNCGPEWFYYQWWLSPASEREAMHTIWDSGARWSWDWWRHRPQCRMTRVSAVKELLQRQFGSGWKPPLHTINA